MPSQWADHRENGRSAKDNSQSTIVDVVQCLLTNFLPDLRRKVPNHRPPKSGWTAPRIKLSQCLDSLRPSQVSDCDDGNEAQAKQEQKPLPEWMRLFI